MAAGFDAPGLQPPGVLPITLEEQSVTTRPQLSPGGEPVAAVILLDFEVMGNG